MEKSFTIAARLVEFGLDDHVGDEMRGLTRLFQQSLSLRLGRHLPILFKFLADFDSRLYQHEFVAGK
ncbi:hypothetical protein TorRG33x02_081910, partial [Trema orientale]